MLAAFAVLFAIYHAPEVANATGLAPTLAQALMLGFFPAAWALARWRGLPWRQAYLLDRGRADLALRLWLFVLAVAAKAIALMVGVWAGIYAWQGWHGFVPAAALPALGALLLLTFVPSLAEDMLTRGLWMGGARSPGARCATLVAFTALVYVLNHLSRLPLGPLEWVMLFCFGLAYGAAACRLGTLWAALALHWGWNFAGQWADTLASVDVAQPGAARMLSAAAHLALLAAVMLLPRAQQVGRAD